MMSWSGRLESKLSLTGSLFGASVGRQMFRTVSPQGRCEVFPSMRLTDNHTEKCAEWSRLARITIAFFASEALYLLYGTRMGESINASLMTYVLEL